MMFKRAIVIVGIAAVLLTGSVPSGNACGLDEAVLHACCATPEPEPASSCCTSSDVQRESPDADRAIGCTCEHAPAAQVAVLNITGSNGLDYQGVEVVVELLPFGGFEASTRSTSEHRVRSHPPPPAYLLNCANLN